MNKKDNLIKTLITDLDKLSESSFISFDGRELVIDYSKSPSLKDSFSNLLNVVESLPQKKISILLTNVSIDRVLFFYNEEDFIKRCKLSIDDFEDSDIIFINPEGVNSKQKTNSKVTNKFSRNYLSYIEILFFFKNTIEFASFDDNTNRIITIVSKTYGIFKIGYQLPNFKFFYGIDLENKSNRLREEFKKKEFIQFFKEIVITSSHSKKESERFKTIIRQLDSIIDLTSKDYEAYVSNFAIDKIKANFKEERESYFENIDRNIGSIEKQVVSFPLTFAASVFGVYKVQEKAGVILLILLAYLLYSIIAILILRMTSYNVKCLKSDVDEEQDKIRNSYQKQYSNFDPEFKKIKIKISNLRAIISVLYLVLIFLFLIFTLYAAHNMCWIDLEDWSNFFSSF